jgi:phenylpropionate dioxygenase-like ring-hydroxylating dioxygenase large terminal subunit
VTLTAEPSTSSPPSARSNGPSYQELLDTDTHQVPSQLRAVSPGWFGNADIPVERYTSRAFHELEKEKVWRRVWQFACREEHLPEVGDSIVYEIADMSFVVVRTAPDTIKAYWNACLHRGRQLRDGEGNCTEFRCPFHGYAWTIEGDLKHVPAKWDFPHVKAEDFHLPEAKVGTWGGFVFINPDPDAESLDDFLGPEFKNQFERWPLEERYVQAHVAKIMKCNWKVVQEAFSEAFHVVATHPQLLAGIGDENTQYDVFGHNAARAITPNGTPSPHISWVPDQQQMFNAMMDTRLDDEPAVVLTGDMTARSTAAALSREVLRPVIGNRVDELCDAEMVDSFYYTVFPNFHPWGAYNRIVYRFRPNGDDHETSIMECLFMAPFNGERPAPAPMHWLTAEEDWTDAPELGLLGRVFNQDSFNIPNVQKGMKNLKFKGLTMANYQETKIRQVHTVMDEYIAKP